MLERPPTLVDHFVDQIICGPFRFGQNITPRRRIGVEGHLRFRNGVTERRTSCDQGPCERGRGLAGMLGRLLVAASIVVALTGVGIGWARADSDALWRIVHELCVPHERLDDDPDPCALVDLSGGEDRGFAVLKDIDGATQFLLIRYLKCEYLYNAWHFRQLLLAE
jgi:CDP-diacylglycerol pyrophosphatase